MIINNIAHKQQYWPFNYNHICLLGNIYKKWNKEQILKEAQHNSNISSMTPLLSYMCQFSGQLFEAFHMGIFLTDKHTHGVCAVVVESTDFHKSPSILHPLEVIRLAWVPFVVHAFYPFTCQYIIIRYLPIYNAKTKPKHTIKWETCIK